MDLRVRKRMEMKIKAYEAMDDYYQAKAKLQQSYYNRLHQICDRFEDDLKDCLSWKCVKGDAKHLAARMNESQSARAHAAKNIYELRVALEPKPKGLIETYLEEKHA